MSDLVGNPEDLFSHNEAHIIFSNFCSKTEIVGTRRNRLSVPTTYVLSTSFYVLSRNKKYMIIFHMKIYILQAVKIVFIYCIGVFTTRTASVAMKQNDLLESLNLEILDIIQLRQRTTKALDQRL